MNTLTDADRAVRGERMRALHERDRPFIVPNAYDAGTAKLLAALGFEALATTSSGLAFSLGVPDGQGRIGRDATLANARSIAEATSLPVTADLENCFADDPSAVGTTIRLAAEAGLAGGSIEDATGRPEQPLYPLSLATERVHAAVEAANALPHPFVLTARAENYIYGIADPDDVMRRLESYASVGAHVLYAPFVPLDLLASIVRLTPRPVNALVSSGNANWTVSRLAALGVRRISVGGALARAALTAVSNAAHEILGGSFGYGATLQPFPKF
jgi:2-methylisocitrate lyase-like PEP mutase family enzyme